MDTPTMPDDVTAPPTVSIRDKRIVVVLNRASGSWNATCEREVEQLLSDSDLTNSAVLGAAPAEIDATLDRAVSEAEILVVLGGDGTIRSAAEKILGKPIILAPLPGGTMNMLPKALYGERPWKLALSDTLANPEIHDVSGGMVGDHAFFVAALFGAPTLWADAREAAREGHVLEAAQKSVTAARRGFSEPLHYNFGDRSGSAEAVVVVCPLISRVLDDSERCLEAAAIETPTAGDVLRLGFHALMDDWRLDPAVSRAKVQSASISGHGALPVILDGERVKMGRRAEVRYLPLAFRALAPAKTPA
jgi:diacylglycerol kinase family enzyme